MRRAVRWGVTGAAALAVLWWLGAGAVVSDPERDPPAPGPIEIAAIEIPATKVASAEPTAPPAPPPRRPPPPPPPPAPPAQAVELPPAVEADPELLSRGAELLAEGAFPRLRATYVRIGFEAYRRALVELGGAFYLYDARERQPVVEIDGRTGEPGSGGERGELSRWPRDVTRHLPDALERGRERYGARVSHVVLLPPARLDAALLGAVDRRLRQLGLEARPLSHIDVAYELRGGRLQCEVLSVGLPDGSERALGLRVDLSGGVAS